MAENLRVHSGSLFEPNMVEAMCQLVNKDGFWYSMDVNSIEQMAVDFEINHFYDKELDLDGVIQLARFLAK